MVTVLAVAPHPDDESYSFGGLLALAAGHGARCVVLALTSGDRGEDHRGASVDVLHGRREHELADSCRILGCEPPRFVRLPDGGLADARAAIRVQVEAVLADVRPDVMLSLGPDGVYGHPDHLAAWSAVYETWLAGPRAALLAWPVFPAGLFVPQYAQCVATGLIDPAGFAPTQIGGQDWQVAVDIREAAAAKLGAIAAHRSQLPGGDPAALFPPGIVGRLLAQERFCHACDDEVRARKVFESLAPGRIICD